MKDKIDIALGYYKKVLLDKIVKLNSVETVSRDKFISHISHTDLLRMHEQGLIDKETYDYLYNHIN